ncbi:hypothetical protein [Lysobacter solisilvae (ex Woo and Kim 2020)]|uniref:Uncharacterized protein n=1 Tax=Agrilutibacter terrestris TaxID=2865112 RepID=A0A7H0FXZ1_9GAMM|nr:hypothetical protein [Lysobacter terrestris]QNP40907.1 hypothetical protein H8B22_01220 [Lysobacter terrestris]
MKKAVKAPVRKSAQRTSMAPLKPTVTAATAAVAKQAARKATAAPVQPSASSATQVEKTPRRRAARNDATATLATTAATTASTPISPSPPRKLDGDATQAAQPHHITPEQALANTRALLEAKHARASEPPPWRQFDTDQSHPVGHHAVPERDASQEAQAEAHAEQRHRDESRLEATQGSIGEQDRKEQTRRDAGE